MRKEMAAATSQDVDIIGGSSEERFDTSSVEARYSLNEWGTRPKIDAWLTQWCSLPVQDGWRVYFIQGGDFIKIGFSTNPMARLRGLRTACPFDLKLLADIPGSKDDELQIHRMFADLHVRGEWFRNDARILAFIKQTRAKRRTRPSGPKPRPR